jgi:hypothetical protein
MAIRFKTIWLVVFGPDDDWNVAVTKAERDAEVKMARANGFTDVKIIEFVRKDT